MPPSYSDEEAYGDHDDTDQSGCDNDQNEHDNDQGNDSNDQSDNDNGQGNDNNDHKSAHWGDGGDCDDDGQERQRREAEGEAERATGATIVNVDATETLIGERTRKRDNGAHDPAVL